MPRNPTLISLSEPFYPVLQVRVGEPIPPPLPPFPPETRPSATNP